MRLDITPVLYLLTFDTLITKWRTSDPLWRSDTSGSCL